MRRTGHFEVRSGPDVEVRRSSSVRPVRPKIGPDRGNLSIKIQILCQCQIRGCGAMRISRGEDLFLGPVLVDHIAVVSYEALVCMATSSSIDVR